MKIRIMNKDNREGKRLSKMSSGLAHKRHQKRRVPKAELRYRIVENTMRGYFNYSV